MIQLTIFFRSGLDLNQRASTSRRNSASVASSDGKNFFYPSQYNLHCLIFAGTRYSERKPLSEISGNVPRSPASQSSRVAPASARTRPIPSSTVPLSSDAQPTSSVPQPKTSLTRKKSEPTKLSNVQSASPNPFYLYEQFHHMQSQRLSGKVHYKYPDITTFQVPSVLNHRQKAPTPQDMIRSLQRCNPKDAKFEDLQRLGEEMAVYSKWGKGSISLGGYNGRNYQLRFYGVSAQSLNITSSTVAPTLASCFRFYLRPSGQTVGLGGKIPLVLPLGFLLFNGKQLPWIIVMNESKELLALHSETVHASDIVDKNSDIYTVCDGSGNNVSREPFSCRNSAKPRNWTADDSKFIYNLGSVARLNDAARPNARIPLTKTELTIPWSVRPCWTFRIVISARYFISGLQQFDFDNPTAEALNSLLDARVDFEVSRTGSGGNIFPLGRTQMHQYSVYSTMLKPKTLNEKPGKYQTKELRNLGFFRGNSTEPAFTVVAYPLGFLLVEQLPVPWIVLIDRTHCLWAVRVTHIDPEDDIRLFYHLDPDDDEGIYDDELEDFVMSPVIDSHGHDLAKDTFGINRPGVIFGLGNVSMVLAAMDNPKSPLRAREYPQYSKWATMRI